MEGVYKQTVNAGKWVLIKNIFEKALNFGTFLILARFLLPSDYGVIAVVFIVVGFFQTVTAPGFQKALMQKQGDADEYLDVDWTFNLLKSFLIAIIIFFTAPYLANFFHVEDYVSIIRWSSVFVVITAFGNSRQYYFFKNLDFKKIFWRDIVSQIVYIIATLLWVLYVSASPWALFVGHLFRFLAGMSMSYILYPNWQKISFKFRKLKDLWGYSKWVIGQNFFNYIIGIIDSVYVGHFLDVRKLGLFTKARDLSYAPVAPFMNIVTRVGFPAYAQIQEKTGKVKIGFIRTLDVILSVTIPLAVLLLVEGGIIVKTLLGVNWLSLVLPLKIFAIATIFSSLAGLVKPVFDALGKPEMNVKINALQLISLIIFIYIGVHYWDLIGVVWALVISWGLTFTYSILRVKPLLQLGWRMIAPTVISVFGSVMFVIIVAAPSYIFWIKNIEDPIYVFPWLTVFGSLYLITLWFMGKFYKTGPKHTFLSIVKEVRNK